MPELRPIEPIKLVTLDGQTRQFLLSMGGCKRLKERFDCKLMSDILQRDAVECGIPILYEALMDKNGMTEDQFAELLPADLPATAKAIVALLGASMPEATNGNHPTNASAPTSN